MNPERKRHVTAAVEAAAGLPVISTGDPVNLCQKGISSLQNRARYFAIETPNIGNAHTNTAEMIALVESSLCILCLIARVCCYTQRPQLHCHDSAY